MQFENLNIFDSVVKNSRKKVERNNLSFSQTMQKIIFLILEYFRKKFFYSTILAYTSLGLGKMFISQTGATFLQESRETKY